MKVNVCATLVPLFLVLFLAFPVFASSTASGVGREAVSTSSAASGVGREDVVSSSAASGTGRDDVLSSDGLTDTQGVLSGASDALSGFWDNLPVFRPGFLSFMGAAITALPVCFPTYALLSLVFAIVLMIYRFLLGSRK